MGLAIYLRFVKIGGNRWLILSSLLGFLGAGGALNISALFCGLYLLTCVYALYQRRKAIVYGFPFVASFLGALVNACAPGNYVRAAAYSTKLNAVNAIGYSFATLIERIFFLSTNSFFIIAALSLFVVTFNRIKYDFGSNIKYQHPLLLIAGCLLFGVMVNFPYVFGSRATSIKEFSGRTYFAIDITIYILSILWILYFGGWLKKKGIRLNFDRSHVLIISMYVIAFFAIVAIEPMDEQRLTTSYMIEAIASGGAKRYVDYQEELLCTIEGADDVVEIWYDLDKAPWRDPFIRGLGLNQDEEGNDWVNGVYAEWFGKNSIIVH